MMMPSIFGENLFDNFMDDFAIPTFPDVNKKLYGKRASRMMKTDVKEHEDHYEVDIDLPGFKKDEIKIQLKDGYLNVSAEKSLDHDEKTENGTYIRQERYAGSMSRSYYVGERVTKEEIHPKYENGILSFVVPKTAPQQIEAENHYIEIEG